MKVLLVDIETAPNTAYCWGLWDQNIQHDQLVQSGYILCWAAKFLGSDTVHFASRQHTDAPTMLSGIHKLLDAADVVIHYFGSKFDIPTLNKEFVKYHFGPPSPYKQVDLKLVAGRAFRFESNKLDYVAQFLGLGAKVKHRGFQLWVRCMHGDPEAWAEMETYNRGDVTLLEKLYVRLLPWIERHPNAAAYTGRACCPRCQSTRIQKRGTAVAQTRRYARYQCQACAGWFRSGKPVKEEVA